jgi:hypothetical protein
MTMLLLLLLLPPPPRDATATAAAEIPRSAYESPRTPPLQLV